ncbi:MAG: protein-glutamate O-methyltransferase CheR [Spirochaetaceae bacterium]|jgi:chemotaxis protein methyltransferase CheR|nr:protein-glutamate O-methyltransferase CheR [Spirochaetaceae bacterium]
MSEFLNDNMFSKYSSYIYDQSGIRFSESNRSILESRLKERLRQQEISKVEDYFSMILKDQGETKNFLDSITTNLTRFFRNQAHYDTFINYVIPDIVKYKRSRGENNITLWSAGCSTGEEPYTNAMVLTEHLPADMNFTITGSDLSLKSLMKAQMGFYQTNSTRNIPANYLAKYFDEKDKGYQVKDDLKKNIKFDYHNLKFDSGLRNVDILFCRNVLIYFDEAAQKEVIDQFWKVMNNYSYLFIGHSESLFGMETSFEFIKTDWACLYGKR